MWATSIENIVVTDVEEKSNGKIEIVGYEVDEEDNSTKLITKEIVAYHSIPEMEEVELEVQNRRKEFKITTEVKKFNDEYGDYGGGSISGEYEYPYEIVKYGDSSEKPIVMIPDDEYEIISVTVNEKEWPFEADEDGIYIMSQFENMTEDKHVVVTYAYKTNKITINKTDSETGLGLAGAKFKIDQVEERSEPENVIGTLEDPLYKEIYSSEIVKTDNHTLDMGNIIANGIDYITLGNKVETQIGIVSKYNDGDLYYFEESNGKYSSNNRGQNSTVSYSYIPINLESLSGEYTVKVNVTISSEKNYDKGYAVITESTEKPSRWGGYTLISGISGTLTNDYTSQTLKGGKIYYLHVAYSKDSSSSSGDDKFTINTINAYEVTDKKSYNFEFVNGKYIPNNQTIVNTMANSYMEIDLTDKKGYYAVEINAEATDENSVNYLYATITNGISAPAYSSSSGRFMYINGTTEAGDYVSQILFGGNKYYLHLGYRNVNAENSQAIINSINLYGVNVETYGFEKDEYGRYKSNNQGKNDTTASSCIPIDLTEYVGKYDLTVNAEISSEQNGDDYGGLSISDSNEESGSTFLEISGKQSARNYTKILEGGQKYYLHLEYYKDEADNGDTGEDTFTINSIKVSTNRDHLYHTEAVSNKAGQAITDMPYGKYAITEVEAPEGYLLNEEPTIVDFTEDGVHEFTITNKKKERVIVHHYLKDRDGNKTTTTVVEDDILLQGLDENGNPEEKYTSQPHFDLEKYELEKDVNGEYVIPENATGIFEDKDIEVFYYYKEKKGVLTVHHYIEGTNIPVRLSNGIIVDDEVSTGYVGESYETGAKDNLQGYEYVSSEGETTGEYINDSIDVIYYYALPSYTLRINKKNEKNNVIAGIEFKVKNVETNQVFLKETDENGIALFEGLYQFREGTGFTGEYILQEAVSTGGYVKNDTEVRFKVERGEDGKLNITILEGENVINTSSSDETSITFEIINKPTFKLIKKGDNGELLPGAKFKITYESGDFTFGENNRKIGEFIDDKNNELIFTPEDIPEPTDSTEWIQREDGTWESGGTGIDNATSAISSDEFTLTENGTLTFEWAASTEGDEYDYLTYVVTNLDTKETIGGQNNVRIGGNSDISSYDELSFVPVTIDLNSGRYKIEFIYMKDNIESGGLDKGFVRNAKINDTSLNFTSIEYVNPMLWQQREDGTWESGAKGFSNGSSYMYSESFVVNGSGKISFEWAQSSDDGEDMAYGIFDLTKDGPPIAGGVLEGTKSGDNYEELIFNLVEEDMTSGVYSLMFYYRKDESGNGGLDAGFVRNVKVDGNEINNFSAYLPSVSTESDPTQWSKRADGTWQSGGSGIDNSMSTISSDEFTLTENGTLTFEWAASTENINYDYLTYVVTNLDTNETIGGQNNVRMGGNSSISSYDELSFTPVTIDLNSGRYKIEFIYVKDDTESGGLDRGFVRNAKINDTSLNFTLVEMSWQQREDGTWESGAKGMNNGYSRMYSESFIVNESGNVSFEWAQSVAGDGDHLEYMIMNLATHTIVQRGSLQGVNSGDNYDELIFSLVENKLPSGAYSISFGYRKDSSGDGRLDAGFVRNVEFNGVDLNFTDSVPETPDGLTKWQQREDETWRCEGNGIANVESILGSNEFTISEGRMLSFEWAASTENINSDYLYCKIIDLENSQERTLSRIGGNPEIDAYENLEFQQYLTYLPAGRYSIKFVYRKDGLGNGGLDVGFVRNVKLGYIAMETDKDGEIIACLPEGEYKVEEIGVPEGYQLPENVEDRVQSVVIDRNKQKVIEITNELKKFKVTTEVDENSEGERAGGTVTGETTVEPNINFVEEVKYGYKSAREIVVTPDKGYEVSNIKINGVDYEFVKDTSGVVTIPVFEDVKTDYHIKVVFEIRENVIVSSKEAHTEKGLDYVTEGDKITYTIKAKNDGIREARAIIKDSVPAGTTFVEKSITINGTKNEAMTDADLTNGIEVKVAVDGEATVSFDVIVNPLGEEIFEREISNTAVVNEENTETIVTPVKKPNVTVNKSANPATSTKVKASDEITYSIELNNSTGTALTKVRVKDGAPVGTVFETGSMTLESSLSSDRNVDLSSKTEADLKNTGIDVELEAGEIKTLSFTVTVIDTNDGKATDLSNNTTITNIAQVSKNPEDTNPTYEDTNEVTHTYVEPIITSEKTWRAEQERTYTNKEGQKIQYVLEGDTIEYTITATNEGGLGKDVKVVDILQPGMTFVEGSIKVNGRDTAYTLDDLQATGITVNVPAKVGDTNGTATVGFKVTVDELGEDVSGNQIYFGQLKNKATVDGKDTKEVVTNVNKSNIIFGKTVNIAGKEANGQKVRIGDELTYNISVSNTGSLPDTVTISDSVPTNTEYVDNSISVKVGDTTYTADEIETGVEGITIVKTGDVVTGIRVENTELYPGEDIIVSFKVKVTREAKDGDTITNIAIVNGKETEPVTNLVVRPIIDVQKEIAEVTHMNENKEIEGLEDRKDYVVRGDKITYNIRVTNAGGVEGKVIIKDIISDKVNLDVNSIKVGDTSISGMTAEKFASEGIEVTVPARISEVQASEVILSFIVTVKGDASVVDENGVVGDVVNQATWSYKNPLEDPNPSDPANPDVATVHNTKEVTVPIVVIRKEATIERTTEENQTKVSEGAVTAKDEIIYTIVVENTGTSATGKFVVTDDIPEGTTILDSNGGIISDKIISWTIDNLPAKEDNKAEISFTVTVKYAEVMPENIVNIAYVNDKPTNETETPYVKPTPKMETEIVKTGDETTMIGNKVYYKMTYTGKINDFAGKACVTIVDELPYRIDEDKSELNGGKYEEDIENKKYTITWNLPVEEINTYVSTEDYIAGDEYVISAEKEVWLYYTDNLGSEFTNKAIATTQLKEPDLDNPGSDKDVGTPDIAEGTHKVTVKTAYKLPETGRNGTTIFAIIGLMIVGVAVTMGYKAKRKEV